MLPFSLSDEVLSILSLSTTFLWLGAFAILGLRYRRSGDDVRLRIRWLLVPVVLIPFGVATEFLLGSDGAGGVVIWLVWMSVMALITVSVTLGLLRPKGVDVDVVLRRTLVYGALWLAITAAYVAGATLVGSTAGRYLSVPWAVAIGLVAAVLFQPARTSLEGLADRWVFGRRTDPARAIADLGGTLAETFELESLLPRMSSTLESGLDLAWAEVRLDALEAPDADLVVPVVLDSEQLGIVACGPKSERRLDDGRPGPSWRPSPGRPRWPCATCGSPSTWPRMPGSLQPPAPAWSRPRSPSVGASSATSTTVSSRIWSR